MRVDNGLVIIMNANNNIDSNNSQRSITILLNGLKAAKILVAAATVMLVFPTFILIKTSVDGHSSATDSGGNKMLIAILFIIDVCILLGLCLLIFKLIDYITDLRLSKYIVPLMEESFSVIQFKPEEKLHITQTDHLLPDFTDYRGNRLITGKKGNNLFQISNVTLMKRHGSGRASYYKEVFKGICTVCSFDKPYAQTDFDSLKQALNRRFDLTAIDVYDKYGVVFYLETTPIFDKYNRRQIFDDIAKITDILDLTEAALYPDTSVSRPKADNKPAEQAADLSDAGSAASG